MHAAQSHEETHRCTQPENGQTQSQRRQLAALSSYTIVPLCHYRSMSRTIGGLADSRIPSCLHDTSVVNIVGGPPLTPEHMQDVEVDRVATSAG